MLVEFRVANHRSIRAEQALSLEVGRIHDDRDPPPSEARGVRPLLPVAAIYGANASGKSNVIDALAWMQESVVHSFSLDPDEPFFRDPFAWDGGRDEATMFECVIALEGVRYEYGFVLDDERFVEEWLHAYPHGRKQVWFERDASDAASPFKFGASLAGPNESVAAATRPTALFLSAAARFRHAQLDPIYRWFSRYLGVLDAPSIEDRKRETRALERWMSRHIDASLESDQPLLPMPGYRSDPIGALRSLLAAADVGIRDVRLVDEDDVVEEVVGGHRRSRPRRSIQFEHAGARDSTWLDFEEESHGTKTLMLRAPALINALALGGTLVVDELETSLHPLLARHIVRTFNDPKTNPHRAQLIFATHDTRLLGSVLGDPVLRRDQVWLTEKDRVGATKLYPLTDYTPRKAENLERGYLQGRYGAIPFLGSLVADRE